MYSTPTTKPRPEKQQKFVPATQQPKPNPVWGALGNGANGLGKGIGNVANGTGKGLGWFFGELLRPVEAMRTGLIDAFGVKEDSQKR